jgi:hypothetical protein
MALYGRRDLMVVNYRKDIHHSYMVLPKNEGFCEEAYSVRMLQANSIVGIIKPDPRIIDGQVLYYYDITSKQSIDIIYGTNQLNNDQVSRLFTSLVAIIEKAYEYLLNENDLLLVPEHIYIELSTGQVNVCYLPGYNCDIKDQMTTLVEYILNKVDYQDKDAVFYAYNLYAVCRNEGFSLKSFGLAISKKKQDNLNKKNANKTIRTEIEKSNIDRSNIDRSNIDKGNIDKSNIEEHASSKQFPVMMEKISDESEEYYYPLWTYIYTGASFVGAILILIFSINMKLVYTSLGIRIDYGKLTALLLILVCISGYLTKKIWNKNNRLTKIISRQEYVDPCSDLREETTENISKSKLYQKEDVDNRTVLINEKSSRFECYLEPQDKDLHEVIKIKDFPFVIGKQKDKVDYLLDKEIISRYHTKLTKEEDIYYITDLNSTNGTCLNEKPLLCYQRQELKGEDKVTLAGINYYFRIQ